MQDTLIFSNMHAILKCEVYPLYFHSFYTFSWKSSIFWSCSKIAALEEWVRSCCYSFILCVLSYVEILAHLPIAYMHLGLSFVLLHLSISKEQSIQVKVTKYNREESFHSAKRKAHSLPLLQHHLNQKCLLLWPILGFIDFKAPNINQLSRPALYCCVGWYYSTLTLKILIENVD